MLKVFAYPLRFVVAVIAFVLVRPDKFNKEMIPRARAGNLRRLLVSRSSLNS